eukprot:7005193-Pyramimonas_sp.AAC.1
MRRGAEIVREGLERLCLLASASPSADADGRVNQADLRACLSNACPELSRLDQRVVLIHLAEVTDGPGALNMEEVLQVMKPLLIEPLCHSPVQSSSVQSSSVQSGLSPSADTLYRPIKSACTLPANQTAYTHLADQSACTLACTIPANQTAPTYLAGQSRAGVGVVGGHGE